MWRSGEGSPNDKIYKFMWARVQPSPMIAGCPRFLIYLTEVLVPAVVFSMTQQGLECQLFLSGPIQ